MGACLQANANRKNIRKANAERINLNVIKSVKEEVYILIDCQYMSLTKRRNQHPQSQRRKNYFKRNKKMFVGKFMPHMVSNV